MPSREHLGNIQGTFGEYSVNIQVTFRERSGGIQGTLGNIKETLKLNTFAATELLCNDYGMR
jgi:hypothetical protein